MAKQLSVISPSYCAPDSINLQINIEKKAAFNTNGERLFYLQDTLFTLHHRRVIYDDQENPIVTLYDKFWSLHERCKVFRGKSYDVATELLFSVKSVLKTGPMIKLDVYLANSKDESVADFRVVIHGNKNSCFVYEGESPTIVAEMKNNGGFNVLINPNVDYAFIVVLLMIINDMDCSPAQLTASNVTNVRVADIFSFNVDEEASCI